MIENNTGTPTGAHIDADSNDNEIHYNCFIDNVPQAWDDGAHNNWDYNFWSDLPVRGSVYPIQGSALSQDTYTLSECPSDRQPEKQVPTLTPIGMILLIACISMFAAIFIQRKTR
jgi:hypothetical protein